MIIRLADGQIAAAGATLARARQDDLLMVYAIPDGPNAFGCCLTCMRG